MLLLDVGRSAVMDSPGYRIEDSEGVRTFVLRRASVRNALTMQILEALVSALDEVQSDTSIRCFVIRSAEGEVFSAGFDFDELRAMSGREGEVEELLARVTRGIRDCDVPVIAAVSRFCIGAALELVLACDVRVATEDTKFALPIARIGRVYPAEGCVGIARIIGADRLAWMTLTAQALPASVAREWGIVHDIVEGGQSLDDHVHSLTVTMERNSVQSMIETKRLCQLVGRLPPAGSEVHPDDLSRFHIEATRRLQAGGDYNEGVNSFIEHRAPAWSGRIPSESAPQRGWQDVPRGSCGQE